MELFGLIVLLLIVGWQVVALRKELNPRRYPTTIFYSIQSEETDANGIEEGNLNLRKTLEIPISITLGMEFAGVADNRPTLVTRVVFDSEGREVHLKSRRLPMKDLEETRKWYVSRGWLSDA